VPACPRGKRLCDEANGQRVSIRTTFVDLEPGNDGHRNAANEQDQVYRQAQAARHEADGDCRKLVNEHAELKVERLLAMRVNEGRRVLLDEPAHERPDEGQAADEEPCQGRKVTVHCPLSLLPMEQSWAFQGLLMKVRHGRATPLFRGTA
jgi:hypothetical protein